MERRPADNTGPPGTCSPPASPSDLDCGDDPYVNLDAAVPAAYQDGIPGHFHSFATLPHSKRLAAGRAVRDRAGDAQFDFRARPGGAPHIQLPPDFRGPLLHSAETVMTGASMVDDRRIHAFAVVANAHLQAFLVQYLDFDRLSLGMLKCIAHRF